MAKNFDNNAYLEKWDGKIAGIMAAFIVISIALVVWLNKATTPDCTTHDYVYCNTELVGNEPEGEGHGAAGGHGAGHGDAGGHGAAGHGAGDGHGHEHGEGEGHSHPH